MARSVRTSYGLILPNCVDSPHNRLTELSIYVVEKRGTGYKPVGG